MNPIVYIDGKLADAMGYIKLIELANQLATYATTPVDLLTHGESTHHARHRITGKPCAEVEAERVPCA